MKILPSQLKGKHRVVDLDTGNAVRGVLWVDPEEGTAEAYHYQDGRMVYVGDQANGGWQTVLIKGRFKVVAADPPKRPDFNRLLGAAGCARCPSRLTLPGDDLCVRCRRAQTGRPLEDMQRCSAFDAHRCSTCSRDADWSVADEVQATPQQGQVRGGRRVRGGAYLFDRAATVGRRYFCQRCIVKRHEGSRLLDSKGEVIKTEEVKV